MRHNRPRPQSPTTPDRTSNTQAAARIAEAAAAAIVAAGFSHAAELSPWEQKYGSLVAVLRKSLTPDQPDTMVDPALKASPVLKIILGGTMLGKTVDEIEQILTDAGFRPDASAPFGWA